MPADWRLRNDLVVPAGARRLPQIVQGDSKKTQESPCNSLFKPDLIRPLLTPRKHALTCANGTDLVIHDPHRPGWFLTSDKGEVDGSNPSGPTVRLRRSEWVLRVAVSVELLAGGDKHGDDFVC